MEHVTAVILAAGEGKRMKSTLPKVLHSICGRTLLGHVLAAVEHLCQHKIVIVGYGATQVQQTFGDSVSYALQSEQLGTGHALMQAIPLIPPQGDVFVLCGDTPLLDETILSELLAAHRRESAAVTVLTATVPHAYGYGRIIRNEYGMVKKIIEEKDASEAEKAGKEINTGSYIFSASPLLDALQDLGNDNAQHEYYLTDCIELLIRKGMTAASHCLDDYRHALGVNDRQQLAEAGRLLRERINNKQMAAGVTIIDPASTYVDAEVQIGNNTTLLPNTHIKGSTVIGRDCVIGPNCEIIDTVIADAVTVRHSVVTESTLESHVMVGPFAHLRPETILRQGVKVGDFVEIKKSDIGRLSKIPHLAYVGDAQVGKGVNLGAGTIIVNYNGRKKYRTVIEDKAFVGCNSNLLAPLTIGKGAFVAAGSTITKDVPPTTLAVARSQQVNKEGLAARFIDVEEDGEL